MPVQFPPRGAALGAIVVAAVIGGSALGALGWYWLTNRGAAAVNGEGFDVSAVAATSAPPAALTAVPERPPEGLLVEPDNEMSLFAAPRAAAAPAGAADGGARQTFAQNARKYEGWVRDYGIRMTARYPSLRRYGKDWMSYPDLRKLNDDYMRDRDPMAFMEGLARSPNFGKMVAKYASDAGVRAFVADGIKQAPPELAATAAVAVREQSTLQALIDETALALGLPPGTAAAAAGRVDAPAPPSGAPSAPPPAPNRP
jgi:hypothetical protein